MPDREKVIRGLECCIRKMEGGVHVCDECPYDEDFNCLGCSIVLWQALFLLREQGKPDCEHAEWDGTGCLGYCECIQDDEPIEACKRCRKYTGNIGGESTDA